MTVPAQFFRSKYRAIEGGCVSCSGDLATLEALPGVKGWTPWPPVWSS